MKKYILAISAACLLSACGSVSETKTTEYDENGNIVRVVETKSDASDFSAFMASSDGAATTLSADVSKFNLGWNGYGLNWLSVSGVRVKAPVKQNGTDSASALAQTAVVVKATKTSIQTDSLGVNADVKPSTE